MRRGFMLAALRPTPPASREQFQAVHARATACVFASKAAPARVLRCAAPLLPVTDRPLPVCHSACRAVRDRRGGPACRWMRAVPLPGAPCRLGWFGLVAVGWLVGPRVAVALYDDPSRVRRACRARLGWVRLVGPFSGGTGAPLRWATVLVLVGE